MRLLGYALALLVYAAALAALGSPWAGVASAALSLAATIAFECLGAAQAATEAEDEKDESERVESLEAKIGLLAASTDALTVQVAALKRNAALNQVG